jgi:hypothetical protein
MDNIVWTDLPHDILVAALNSDDDVGVFFRPHHLIEQAAEKAAQSLYENYKVLKFDNLHNHLNALAARGAQGPVFRAARTVANHRNDFAHTRTFSVAALQVTQVRSQLEKPDVDSWGVPLRGRLVSFTDLRAAHQYLVLSLSIAGTLEILGKRYRELVEQTAPLQVHSRP